MVLEELGNCLKKVTLILNSHHMQKLTSKRSYFSSK